MFERSLSHGRFASVVAVVVAAVVRTEYVHRFSTNFQYTIQQYKYFLLQVTAEGSQIFDICCMDELGCISYTTPFAPTYSVCLHSHLYKMMPNIPLHSLMEPSWTVPRDENLECSLFALEQQEQEYKAHLDRTANIAAPEPIGTRPSTIHSSSLSSSSNMASSIRFASGSSSNRPRAAMRRNRRSSGGGGGESATPTSRNSYEYPTTTSASRRPRPNSVT